MKSKCGSVACENVVQVIVREGHSIQSGELVGAVSLHPEEFGRSEALRRAAHLSDAHY